MSQHARLFVEQDDVSSPLPLSLQVSDPDTISELTTYAEGADRERFALAALRIGVLALRQASGQLDSTVVRNEADRMITALQGKLQQHATHIKGQLQSTLGEYFDPKSGRFSERVQRLVDKDGELETVLRKQVGTDNSELAKTLASHLGQQSPLMKILDPDQSKGILANIRETVNQQLVTQREHVVRQFSLDDEGSALSRFIRELNNRQGKLDEKLQTRLNDVVREFSLDDEESALSRLVRNVDRAQRTITSQFSLDDDQSALARLKRELTKMMKEQREADQKFREEITGALKAMSARREEAEKSTRHGLEFEDAVYQFVMHDAQNMGDFAEHTGNTTGRIKNCKKGDCVVELGPENVAAGQRIVIEAKQKAGYVLPQAKEEIIEARKNRNAQVGVFVYSQRMAPTGLQSLVRYGDDIIIVWNPEDPATDVYLRAGLTLARALCSKASASHEDHELDFERLDTAILEIEKRTNSLDEIEKSTAAIQNHGKKIAERTSAVRKSLTRQLDELRQSSALMKKYLAD